MLLSLYELRRLKDKFTFYVIGNHATLLTDVILNLPLICSDGLQAKQIFNLHCFSAPRK